MVGLVEAEVTGFALAEEAGVAEDAQVVGDSRPADIRQVCRDVAGGELTLPDEAQDGAPARRRDGVEQGDSKAGARDHCYQ